MTVPCQTLSKHGESGRSSQGESKGAVGSSDPVHTTQYLHERALKSQRSMARMSADGVLRHDELRQTRRRRTALDCVYDFEWFAPEDLAVWEPPDYWKSEHVFVEDRESLTVAAPRQARHEARKPAHTGRSVNFGYEPELFWRWACQSNSLSPAETTPLVTVLSSLGVGALGMGIDERALAWAGLAGLVGAMIWLIQTKLPARFVTVVGQVGTRLYLHGVDAGGGLRRSKHGC